MKIAVATTQGGLEDVVSPVFGRCPTFTLVDVENGKVVSHEVVQNPYLSAMGGAGIQAAQLVISKGAQAILAGAFGPNATNVFSQGGCANNSRPRDCERKSSRVCCGTARPGCRSYRGGVRGSGHGDRRWDGNGTWHGNAWHAHVNSAGCPASIDGGDGHLDRTAALPYAST